MLADPFRPCWSLQNYVFGEGAAKWMERWESFEDIFGHWNRGWEEIFLD